MDRQPSATWRRAFCAFLAGALSVASAGAQETGTPAGAQHEGKLLEITPEGAQENGPPEGARAEALPPEFFEGEYELVGRGVGAEGEALLDWVRIVAAPDGILLLDACRLGLGTLKADWQADEGQMPLTGGLGGWELYCDVFIDRGNYPQLICYATAENAQADIPGLISLWWSEWDKPGHASGC